MITQVKEPKGTRQSFRTTTLQAISTALPVANHINGLYRFIIDILPCFDVCDLKTLESIEYSDQTGQPEDVVRDLSSHYLYRIGNWDIFPLLAFYCKEIGMEFRPELRRRLERLAKRFAKWQSDM